MIVHGANAERLIAEVHIQAFAALALDATLKRQQLFTIYYRLACAKRVETRKKHMAEIFGSLGNARGV